MDNHVNANNTKTISKDPKDSEDDNQSASIQNLQLNNFKRTNATSDEDNYSSCYSQNFQNTLDENFSELSEHSKSNSCNCENNHKPNCKNISTTSTNKAIETIKSNQFDEYLTETAKKQLNEMNKNDPKFSTKSEVIYASIDDSDKVDIFIPQVSESEEDLIDRKNFISSVKIGAMDKIPLQDEGIITIFNKNYHKDDNLDSEGNEQTFNPFDRQDFKGKFYMHDDRNMSDTEIDSAKIIEIDGFSCNSKTELPDSDFGEHCFSSFESKTPLDKILFGSKMDKYGQKFNIVTITENGQLEKKNKKISNKKARI